MKTYKSYEKLILDCGDLAFSIISFIKNIRSKHNIPQKDKLVLYIDLWSKEIEIMDSEIIGWEGNISKWTMGNLFKIEYNLYELFEKDNFFECTFIEGYNIYLALPTIEKKSQLNNFFDEIKRLEEQKINYQNTLDNKNFILKASKDVVESTQKKLNDAENKIQSLESITLMLSCGKEYYDLLIKFGSREEIDYHIQYERELQSTNEKYEKQWFNEVYNNQITENEIKSLYSKLCT